MSKKYVREFMTNQITVASKHHQFSQVMDFFNLFNIRHLPVTENDELVGIISIRDVLQIFSEQMNNNQNISLAQLNEQFNAGNMMTPSPISVKPETTLEEALSIMVADGFHALPVAENNVIKGIITEHDMVVAYHNEKQAPGHYAIETSGFGI